MLHDYLAEQMDLKRPLTIRFRDVDGAVAEIRTHIVNLTTVSGREMIETDSSFSIGVDQLISVNDRNFSNLC